MAAPVSWLGVAIGKSAQIHVSLAVYGPTFDMVTGFVPSAKSIVRVNRFKVKA